MYPVSYFSNPIFSWMQFGKCILLMLLFGQPPNVGQRPHWSMDSSEHALKPMAVVGWHRIRIPKHFCWLLFRVIWDEFQYTSFLGLGLGLCVRLILGIRLGLRHGPRMCTGYGISDTGYTMSNGAWSTDLSGLGNGLSRVCLIKKKYFFLIQKKIPLKIVLLFFRNNFFSKIRGTSP